MCGGGVVDVAVVNVERGGRTMRSRAGSSRAGLRCDVPRSRRPTPATANGVSCPRGGCSRARHRTATPPPPRSPPDCAASTSSTSRRDASIWVSAVANNPDGSEPVANRRPRRSGRTGIAGRFRASYEENRWAQPRDQVKRAHRPERILIRRGGHGHGVCKENPTWACQATFVRLTP